MVSQQREIVLARLLAVGAFSITVFVLTTGVSDPVNSTKLFLLGGFACSAGVLVVSRFHSMLWKSAKDVALSVTLFLIFALISAWLSGAPFTQNLYGIYGRNTGLLTYLFLSLVLVATSTLRNLKSYRTLIIALLAAGGVNLAYCLWVISFGDFVQWNNPYGNILGTFGNPNFIGSFLGMIFAVLFTLFVHTSVKVRDRILLFVAMGIAAFEIQDSSAVQGKVVAAGGTAIVMFYWIRSKRRLVRLQIPYLGAVIVMGALAIAGALQKGPLAELIYKISVSLRGEYWAAGMRMGNENPLVGVGLDTYGDFYRRFRDEQALIVPGPNTVTNTAHNVFIDFYASGGYPLVICYILLVLLATRAIFVVTKSNKHFDPVFVSLVTAWAGYQVQSIISINQIGLAIWGWLLTGALIGYERATKSITLIESQIAKKDGSKGLSAVRNTKQVVFSPTLLAGIGFAGGLLLAVPPLSADMAWTKAVQSQNLEQVESSLSATYLKPLNSFKLAQVTQMLEQSKLFAEAHQYALLGVEFNPDYFEAWKFLYFASNSTNEEKQRALANMKRLDPLNRNLLNQ